MRLQPTRTTLCVALLGAFTAQAASAQQDPPDRGERLPPEVMHLPSGLAVKRPADRKITIDGRLEDWPDLVPIRLDDVRQLSGTADRAWTGPGDLAARMFLLWDDEALYLGGQINDDTHIALTPDRPATVEIPPSDALVLHIDPGRNTTGLGADAGRADDRVFWIGDAGEEHPEQGLVSWDRLEGVAGHVEGGAVRVRRVPGVSRTDVEVRIPWSAILPAVQRPVPGLVIDVQLMVDDFDEVDDPLPQSRVGWTFGTGLRIDPGLLGPVVLVSALTEEARDEIPDLTPKPSTWSDLQLPETWIRYLDDLRKTSPGIFDRTDDNPASIGGAVRLRLLRQLETELFRHPRVDHLALVHRVARRMMREADGISQTGVSFFWRHALGDVARRAVDPPPEGTSFRLFRLPQGGWMVRSRWGNFGIDPIGFELEDELWGGMHFVLLTSPLDETTRNDRLLIRMYQQEPARPVYTHVPIVLPGVPPENMPLVQPGVEYSTEPFRITPHAVKNEEGRITVSAGYTVVFPDGARLVVSSRELREEDFSEPVDLLLLDPRHQRAHIIGQRVRADLTVIDKTLQAQGPLRWGGRVSLREAWDLQKRLLPNPSLLLAPGEFVDVHAGR